MLPVYPSTKTASVAAANSDGSGFLQTLPLVESRHRRRRRPASYMNKPAAAILLGFACVAYLIWVLHKCVPTLVTGAVNRQLAGTSSDEDPATDDSSNLNLLADVCSSLPSVSVPAPPGGAAAVPAEGIHGEESDPQPSTSTAQFERPPLVPAGSTALEGKLGIIDGGRVQSGSVMLSPESERVFAEHSYSTTRDSSYPHQGSSTSDPSKRPREEEEDDDEEGEYESDSEESIVSEKNLANVPEFSADHLLDVRSWSTDRLRLFSMQKMPPATIAARRIHQVLAQPKLSHNDVVTLLQSAWTVTLYLQPLSFHGRNSQKPYYVAPRVGAVLFAIDALFRVTDLFPAVTNPNTWWGNLMSGLNLDFSYTAPDVPNPNAAFIERCRDALRMYSERRRPAPAELHRLFRIFYAQYSRNAKDRRKKEKMTESSETP